MPRGWNKFVAAVLLLAAGVHAEVTITRRPPAVQHKTFDPAHQPPEMPQLTGNEAAVTQSSFECQVAVDYEVLSRKPADGHCTTSIRFQGVRMTLGMKVVVWLPEHAPQKLKAHEEGHRKIDERAYQDADRVAKEIARDMDGQVISGEGATCKAAEKQATDTAAAKLCRLYIERVAKRAARISSTYDQITMHGTRGPAEDEAIRQAFEKEEKGTPGTTQPAQ